MSLSDIDLNSSDETIFSETFKVNPKYINCYQAIFESYEGLALLRTIDPAQGIIELMYHSQQRQDIINVFKSVTEELR